MSEAVREMTFAEETELYEKEARELFAKETPGYETPPINSTVRRGMRIIRKARDEIQWLKKRMQGISVEERLPDEWRDNSGELVNYLIYMPEYGWDVGNYALPVKTWLCMGIPCKVTHWMPLPEPPKEEV